MPLSDARELLEACARGESERRWTDFSARFGPCLRRGIMRAFRRSGGRPKPDVLEDLLQETYCRLLAQEARALRRCESDQALAISAYLARIAERVAIDHLRSEAAEKRGANRVDSLEGLEERQGEKAWLAVRPEAEDRLLSSERRRRFLDICRRFSGRDPGRNLRILRLAFLEGLSSREISRRLDHLISPNGVDSLLHRARRKLALEGFVVPRRRMAGTPFTSS